MNVEIIKNWALAPCANDDAVGAVLRSATGRRDDKLPEDLTKLLSRLDRDRGRRASA